MRLCLVKSKIEYDKLGTEHILDQEPKVMSSTVLGRGLFHVDVLVDPRPEFRFDPADKEKLALFENEIWYAHLSVLISETVD
jgi:hypothetical protein